MIAQYINGVLLRKAKETAASIYAGDFYLTSEHLQDLESLLLEFRGLGLDNLESHVSQAHKFALAVYNAAQEYMNEDNS